MKGILIKGVGILALAGLCQLANAGLVSQGYEWEYRGEMGTFASHRSEARVDEGWQWATLADILASGLQDAPLTRNEYAQLMGDATPGKYGYTAVYHWDVDAGTVGGILFMCELGSDCVTKVIGFDEMDEDLLHRAQPARRLAFRLADVQVVQVPVPGTLALMGLALLGLGMQRRSRNQRP